MVLISFASSGVFHAKEKAKTLPASGKHGKKIQENY